MVRTIRDAKQNEKRAQQLGMPFGTASAKLRKLILFDLLCRLGLNTCFRCDNVIESVDEISIEHKTSWLDTVDPVGRFFDLGNIAFSHLPCNVGAGRRPIRKWDTADAKKAGALATTTRWKREHYSPVARHERYMREGR